MKQFTWTLIVGVLLIASGALPCGCGEKVEHGSGGAVEPETPGAPAPAGVSQLVAPGANTGPALSSAQFVTSWSALGAFALESETGAIDLSFVPEEGKLQASVPAPDSTSWKTVSSSPTGGLPGYVDLQSAFGQSDLSAVYAVAVLHSGRAQSGVSMKLGSDDYLKVYLNGALVHTYRDSPRTAEWDQDVVRDLTLQKGLNRIVVKCVDVDGGFGFFLRFTDTAGRPFTVRKGK